MYTIASIEEIEQTSQDQESQKTIHVFYSFRGYFSFNNSKVKKGKHFLVILVPVEESEIRPDTAPQIPEVVRLP